MKGIPRFADPVSPQKISILNIEIRLQSIMDHACKPPARMRLSFSGQDPVVNLFARHLKGQRQCYRMRLPHRFQCFWNLPPVAKSSSSRLGPLLGSWGLELAAEDNNKTSESLEYIIPACFSTAIAWYNTGWCSGLSTGSETSGIRRSALYFILAVQFVCG